MTISPFLHVIIRGSKNGVGHSTSIGNDVPVIIRIFNSLLTLMKAGWYFRIVHTFADTRKEIMDSCKRAVDTDIIPTHIVYIDGTNTLHDFSTEDFINAIRETYITTDFVCVPSQLFCQTMCDNTNHDILRCCVFDRKESLKDKSTHEQNDKNPKSMISCDKPDNDLFKHTKPKSKRRVSSTASEPSIPLRRSSRLNPSIDA